MKILYVAEIVGKAGVYAFKKALPELKRSHPWDFLVACADGTTGGNGLGRNHAAYLSKLGANVLTLGECCFYKKDLTENLEKLPYVLRPDNLNPEAPGFGARVYKTQGARFTVPKGCSTIDLRWPVFTLSAFTLTWRTARFPSSHSFVKSPSAMRTGWRCPRWAIEHRTGAPLAFCFGTKEGKNLDDLPALLEPFNVTKAYADNNPAYASRLPGDTLETGKRDTQKIERKHLSLRTWCSRLVRKGIRFSKRHDMHRIVVALVINFWFFGRILA